MPDRFPVNGLDDYTFHWILGLARYISHSGDVRYLQKVWQYLSSATYAIMSPARMEKGLYQAFPDGNMFVDWVPQSQESKLLSGRMMHAWALSEAAFLANVIGKEKEEEHWRGAFETAKDALNDFWNASRGLYLDKDGNAPCHAQFLAILAGVADDDMKKRLSESILSNDSGLADKVGTPYMKYFELKALSLVGKRKEMVDEIRRYWGGMIDMGATTFWEAFTPGESKKESLAMYGRPFARSLSHAWAAGAAALLACDVVGLRQKGIGWADFSYEKQLPSDMGIDHLDITIPTPKGDLRVEYDGRTVSALRG